MNIVRTNSANPDFAELIGQLDRHLWSLFGNGMEYFQQFNIINGSDTVVLAYDGERPVGCGCLREFDANTTEVKRMFVVPACRGMGVATAVLRELETWAEELNYDRIVLETGQALTSAVSLYTKHDYRPIDRWGPYVEIETSICMEKRIAGRKALNESDQ